jgi:hypothetical protein
VDIDDNAMPQRRRVQRNEIVVPLLSAWWRMQRYTILILNTNNIEGERKRQLK